MRSNITTTACLLLLASSTCASLGDTSKGSWVATRAPKAESTTILLAANGQDPTAVADASNPNVYSFADNSFAFGNSAEEMNVFTGGRASTLSHALIIPKDNPDPKTLAEVEEDMGVMAHILNKAASGRDEKSKQAMGIVVHSTTWGMASAPRNIFIEGYGALFFLNVNFPLLAPADKKQESEAKEETSSEWEDARRELHRPPGQFFGLTMPGVTGSSTPAEEYDADKVEDLKKELIASLKNGAHIRKLKADETITVIVTGRSSSGVFKTLTRKSGSGHSVNSTTVHSSTPEPRATKLILRAKKSDLESFQKDKLSPEDFRTKVSVIIY